MSEDIREQAGRRLFDSHCHIIDPRFPIVANNGYTPRPFHWKRISPRPGRSASWRERSFPARSRPTTRPT